MRRYLSRLRGLALVAPCVGAMLLAPQLVGASNLTIYPVPTHGSGPYHIVRGSDGAFWFTEIEGSKIGRITSSGSVTEFPLARESYPHGLTSASDGGIWFAEYKADKIGRIHPQVRSTDPAPKIVEYALPAGELPKHIVQFGKGDLFFTESGTSSIGRMTLSGRYVTSYPVGTHGGLNGIAAASNAIWFEQTDGRIGRLDPVTGAVTEHGGISGVPHHVARGPDGNLWFTEPSSGRIGRMNPTSGAVSEWTIPPRAGYTSYPNTAVAGPNLTVLFPDSGSGQIDMFDTRTQKVSVTSLPSVISDPVGIATAPDGSIWFCEDAGSAIGHLTGF